MADNEFPVRTVVHSWALDLRFETQRVVVAHRLSAEALEVDLVLDWGLTLFLDPDLFIVTGLDIDLFSLLPNSSLGEHSSPLPTISMDFSLLQSVVRSPIVQPHDTDLITKYFRKVRRQLRRLISKQID